MSSYKDIIVKVASDGGYFGIQNGTYWLCAGGLISCDCPCDTAGEALRASKIVETITWAGEFIFQQNYKNPECFIACAWKNVCSSFIYYNNQLFLTAQTVNILEL